MPAKKSKRLKLSSSGAVNMLQHFTNTNLPLCKVQGSTSAYTNHVGNMKMRIFLGVLLVILSPYKINN